MKKLKFMVCISLFASISIILSPIEGIAEPVDKPGEKTVESGLKDKKAVDKEKYSYCDPKMLIPGNPDIDPKILIPGDTSIDPGMLIKIPVKQPEKK